MIRRWQDLLEQYRDGCNTGVRTILDIGIVLTVVILKGASCYRQDNMIVMTAGILEALPAMIMIAGMTRMDILT